MAWQIHYRKYDVSHRATAPVLAEAIALACQILREGHILEKIQPDTGLTLGSHEVKPLCGEFC